MMVPNDMLSNHARKDVLVYIEWWSSAPIPMSEVDLLEHLNVEQRTLDRLRREKGLPYVRPNAKCRVHLAEDVLD